MEQVSVISSRSHAGLTTQMSNNKTCLLMPEYMNEFKCLGSACETVWCCKAWNIDIDKETYEKYEGCDNPGLREMFRERVVKNQIGSSDRKYARVLMDDGWCPFLTEEKLCRIQWGLAGHP